MGVPAKDWRLQFPLARRESAAVYGWPREFEVEWSRDRWLVAALA